jgi:hypothetical protein
MLASGLPEIVGDDEKLARFLPSSKLFTTVMVKPAAFLPSRDGETSVFRHGDEPPVALWRIAAVHVTGRTVHGAAIVLAREVRATRLDVISAEPPPRHAVITGWPTVHDDPQLQKAQQKERAVAIASNAILVAR